MMRMKTPVGNGRFVTNVEVNNWMGFPPSVQRMLGMMWMAKLLYPDAADYDLQAEVTEYFKLFYHTDLTDEAYNALVANSIGTVEVKAAA